MLVFLKKILSGAFVLTVVSNSIAFAFEINTHQALTRCANNHECSAGNVRSENLFNFVHIDADLGKETYKDQNYPNYDRTYLRYARSGQRNFINLRLSFKYNGDYRDMIEAGVILEDAGVAQ